MTQKAKGNVMFSDLAREWLDAAKSKVKPSSYAQYSKRIEKNILPYFENARLREIDSAAIAGYVEHLQAEKFTEKYIYDLTILLRSILKNAAHTMGYPDPTAGMEALKSGREPSAPQALDHGDEFYRRLNKVLTEDTDLTKCGILLTLYTGLKIGELCALKWADIDLKAGKITVVRSIQRISTEEGSTLIFTESDKRAREIPLTGTLCDILKKWETRDEYYLLSGNDAPIEPRTMQYRLRALLKKEYLPDVSFSGLRKLFIKRCISHGAQVTVLADILGNSSVQSAAAYCEKPTLSGKIRTIDLMVEEVNILP